MSDPPKPGFAASPTRCPYCHESASPDESRVCTDCLARHHPECWREHGRCSGCGSKRFLQPGGPAPDDGALTGPRVAGRAWALGRRAFSRRLPWVIALGLGAATIAASVDVSTRLWILGLVPLVGVIVGWRNRSWYVPLIVTTLLGVICMAIAALNIRPISLSLVGVNALWGLVGGLVLGVPGAIAARLSRSAAHQLIEEEPVAPTIVVTHPPEEQPTRPPEREKA